MRIPRITETQSHRVDNLNTWTRRLTRLGTPPTDDDILAKLQEKWPIITKHQREQLIERAKKARENALSKMREQQTVG